MQQTNELLGEDRWNYLKVAKQLRQEILQGTYKFGKRLPGEPALARRFGVGRVTVSKALAILQRAGLIFRVAGSGTYVQPGVARGAARLTIGYLIGETSPRKDTPSGMTLEAARETLERRQHIIKILGRCEIFRENNPLAKIRTLFTSGEITGLIVAEPLDPLLLRQFAQILPVVVCLHDNVPEDILCVPVDFAWGYFLTTRHLLELGHRKIGLLRGSLMDTFGYRALQAFRLAVQQAGLDAGECPVVYSGYELTRARPAAQSLLAEHPEITGLVCGCDNAAMAVLEAARAQGRSVPKDLSVVGCNDRRIAAGLEPPLTTLRIDFAKVGRKAVETLLGQIYGNARANRTYIQPELVVRASTAPPPRC